MSRSFAAIAAFGASVAAPEINAAVPYVRAALDEVKGDLASSDPAGMLLKTASSAYSKMKSDPAVKPSLSSILVLLGAAAMNGYTAYLNASADPAEGEKPADVNAVLVATVPVIGPAKVAAADALTKPVAPASNAAKV